MTSRMKTKIAFISALYFLVPLVWMSPDKQCPEKCICENSDGPELKVDCSAHKVIPDSPINTTTLKFEGQRLISLDNNTFEGKHLLDLKRLSLRNNEIQHIQRNATSGLPKLEYLDLSRNNIKTVDPHSFEQSPFLNKLVMTDNPNMKFSNDSVFLYSDSIKFLYLGKNNLSISNPLVFSGLRNLKYLDITGNPHINCKHFEKYASTLEIFRCDDTDSGNNKNNTIINDKSNSSTVKVVNTVSECNCSIYLTVIIVLQLIIVAVVCRPIYYLRKLINKCHKNSLHEFEESSTEKMIQRQDEIK